MAEICSVQRVVHQARRAGADRSRKPQEHSYGHVIVGGSHMSTGTATCKGACRGKRRPERERTREDEREHDST